MNLYKFAASCQNFPKVFGHSQVAADSYGDTAEKLLKDKNIYRIYTCVCSQGCVGLFNKNKKFFVLIHSKLNP